MTARKAAMTPTERLRKASTASCASSTPRSAKNFTAAQYARSYCCTASAT
eukprot:CAMPEP_0177771800 /NCGR_PEP_ID=MMETSP0491_2-20121128/11831_1 /TAXON_ID=63592 /ORGANISM="Tetraselmis chuii, Strain PLY429" /LENGTH=49 /DNA_ID=CAMNT_0019289465 /DNA_START=150 /DNA_END=299 /DNA_ORIENTATION=-